jgi:hypothetical protein
MGEPSLELWTVGGRDESSLRDNCRRRRRPIVIVPPLMEPRRSHGDVLGADGFVFGLRAGPTSGGSNDMLRVGPVSYRGGKFQPRGMFGICGPTPS